jgi:hypothetical protein
MSLLTVSNAVAATAPTLGDAASFAVLGASTVTNTGPSEVHGDLGVSPGTAITGFPPGQQVPPTLLPHAGDQAAGDAQADVVGAYNSLSAEPCTQNLTGQDLGGLTLVPGVYCFDSSAFLTGTLTLNAVDGAASVFVFKTESTLITASGSQVEFLNGGTCNGVYWRVGSSATLGTGSLFEGTIVALTSITATTGANVNGRLLARNAAVTLDSNKVTGPTCGIETEPEPEDSDTTPTDTTPTDTTPTDTTPTDTTPTDTTPTDTTPTDSTTTVVEPGTTLPPGATLTQKVTTPSTGTKIVTTTHEQLVTTGADILPLGLSALTALLIGSGFLLESRRRTKKSEPARIPKR